MDLKSTQLKDTYGNLLTIGTTEGSPQTGTLQNGDGEDITALDIAGTITADGAEIIGDVAINTTTPATYLHIVPTDGELNDVFEGFRVSRSNSLKASQFSTYSHAGGSATITSTVTTSAASGSFRVLSSADGSTTKNLLNISNGNDVSFYEDTGSNPDFFWDASAGSLGIGITTPDGTLHVHAGSAGTVTAQGVADDLVVENSTDGGISILTPDANFGKITFGSPAQSEGAILRYNQASSTMTIGTEIASGLLQFRTGSGTERMRIDGSGRVGIGVSPSAWNSIYKVLQTDVGSIASSPNYNSIYVGANVFYDASNTAKYIRSDFATLYAQDDGIHNWFTASSGTAGDTISFSESMRIDSSGNVNIYGTDNRPLAITSFATASAGAGWDLDATSANGVVTVSTGNTERMRIDSSGNVLVGKTTANNTTAGVTMYGTVAPGNVSMVRDSGNVLILNRTTNDGDIAVFRKDGTTVGQIGAIAGLLTLGSNNNVALTFTSSSIRPSNNDGSGRDNAIDLGQSGNRFNDLYLGGDAKAGTNVLVGTTTARTGTNSLTLEGSNSFFMIRAGGTGALSNVSFFRNTDGTPVQVGVISTTGTATTYGTSSDYRLKENVVEMTGALDRVDQLNPSRFNFISDADTTVDGFLAHEVGDVVPEAITGEKDATEEYEVTPAVLDDDGNVIEEAVMGTRPVYQSIDHSKLVPLLVGAIQELRAEIEQLKNQ